ncbi:hypothetical protein CKO15_10960 [Halorhodospira abdelmalekii]|uniref:hypothetical protein n=1 Tax=Halorhodospira abdelmalekii TaxID=421629 RepID=UPI00190404B5|nr:hypothetical protein [Halorhodospira abdelmalekii]MBK1735787.1 hypothetical protein [Halorhodospira abdelmalekii]
MPYKMLPLALLAALLLGAGCAGMGGEEEAGPAAEPAQEADDPWGAPEGDEQQDPWGAAPEGDEQQDPFGGGFEEPADGGEQQW